MPISPIMSYGPKRTALSKANRTQLRKYERLITQTWQHLPPTIIIKQHMQYWKEKPSRKESLLIVSVTGHTFKEDVTTHILKDSKFEFKKHWNIKSQPRKKSDNFA
jgi:hypothetical protein